MSYWHYILLYGKITRFLRPEFCEHFARRRSHLHSRKRHFLITFGCARNPSNLCSPLTNRLPEHFFSRSRKKSEKSIPRVWMAPKWITFSRPSFIFFFQEIRKATVGARFLRAQKRFKKWWKLRILTCSNKHSHTQIMLPHGYPKSCKMTRKFS